jgi:thioredoxin reductase (NADPH)
MFFCKDCDAYRVMGQRIAIIGHNNETVEYALGMVLYSPCVIISTNGHPPAWDALHENWVAEYEIPVRPERIVSVAHRKGKVCALEFEQGERVAADCVFTTRGDIYHNSLAQSLGAKLDAEGQIAVDDCGRTSVAGLYAAGCVTPANCQMIVAAGQAAMAAQAINRDLFEESLRNHSLRRYRAEQLRSEQTEPELLQVGSSS